MIALEIIAVTMGVGSVFLSLKRNIWVYPVGIISTGIYVYLLYVFGLLGDCLINIYYTGMSIYGWVLWSKNTTDNVHINVSVASKKEWIQASLLFIGSLLLVILVYYYKPWLDNDFDLQGVTIGLHHLDWANWLDVFTTSVFLIGMWLMAKQKLENWLFWIIGDLICIPIFVYKGLIFTSLQYFVFSILAIIAYFEWRKNYRLNQ